MIRVKVLGEGTVPVRLEEPKGLGVETKGTMNFITDVDYNNLKNKPQINDCVLIGNRSFDDIGIRPMSNLEIEKMINESLGGF